MTVYEPYNTTGPVHDSLWTLQYNRTSPCQYIDLTIQQDQSMTVYGPYKTTGPVHDSLWTLQYNRTSP